MHSYKLQIIKILTDENIRKCACKALVHPRNESHRKLCVSLPIKNIFMQIIVLRCYLLSNDIIIVLNLVVCPKVLKELLEKIT